METCSNKYINLKLNNLSKRKILTEPFNYSSYSYLVRRKHSTQAPFVFVLEGIQGHQQQDL